MEPLSSEWAFAANTRIFQSLGAEQREARVQDALPLLGNFSHDLPRVCRALGIHIHPQLLSHIAPYQPKPKPTSPPPPPVDPTAGPTPDSPPSAVTTATLAPPPPQTAPSVPLPSPKPPSSPSTKKGVAADLKAKDLKNKPQKPSPPQAPSSPPRDAPPPPPPKAEEEEDAIPKDERRTLALRGCDVDAGTVAALLLCLAPNRCIDTLSLTRTRMTEEAAALLGQVTARSWVQRLNIDWLTLLPGRSSSSSPSSPSSPHPLLSLVPSLSSSPLQLLSLQSVGLTDADAVPLLASLADNRTLLSLDLSQNPLSTLSTTALTTSLLTNQTLAHLALIACPLTASHLASLFSALLPQMVDAGEVKGKKGGGAGGGGGGGMVGRVQGGKGGRWWREANGSLRVLDVSWCEGGEGLVKEVRELREGKEGGEVGDVGWTHGLEVLRLEGCGVDEEGWKKLRAMRGCVQVEEEWARRWLHPSTTVLQPLPTDNQVTEAAAVRVSS